MHSGRWIKQQLRTVKVQSLCGPCSHKGTCLSCPCPHASETIMEEGLNGLKKPEMGNWVKVISERTKPLCSLPHSSCGCLHKTCASTSHSAQCACSVGRKEPAAAASCWKKSRSCRKVASVGWPCPRVWFQTHEHMASMNWTRRILEKNRNKNVKLGEHGGWEVRIGAVRGE